MLHVVVWIFGAIGFLVTGMVLYHRRASVGDLLKQLRTGIWAITTVSVGLSGKKQESMGGLVLSV